MLFVVVSAYSDLASWLTYSSSNFLVVLEHSRNRLVVSDSFVWSELQYKVPVYHDSELTVFEMLLKRHVIVSLTNNAALFPSYCRFTTLVGGDFIRRQLVFGDGIRA